jgi:hypothetical protein
MGEVVEVEVEEVRLMQLLLTLSLMMRQKYLMKQKTREFGALQFKIKSRSK